MNENNDKMVSHPAHYQSKTGLEVFDVIEAFTSDLEGIEAFDAGNIIKYICRWKNKNGLQDLKKAREYLDHLIEHIEKPDKPTSEPLLYFGTKEDADKALTAMWGIVKTLGIVTMADMYDIARVAKPYLANEYGWVEQQFQSARVSNNGQDYFLCLPKPIKLKTTKKEND